MRFFLVLLFVTISNLSFTQEITQKDFDDMAKCASLDSAFYQSKKGYFDKYYESEYKRDYLSLESNFNDLISFFKPANLFFGKKLYKTTMIDTSWSKAKIKKVELYNKKLIKERENWKNSAMQLDKLAKYPFYRNRIRKNKSNIIPFLKRVLFEEKSSDIIKEKVSYLIPILDLPKSLIDSIMKKNQLPPLVLAALGNKKIEKTYIDSFLSQINDTILYLRPQKKLTENLFYINSENTWNAFAKGLSAKRYSYTKQKADSVYYEYYNGVAHLDYWKLQPFAACLIEQYNIYFKGTLGIFDKHFNVRNLTDSLVLLQRSKVTECIKTYIENRHNVEVNPKQFLMGYSYCYVSKLEPKPSDTVLISLFLLPPGKSNINKAFKGSTPNYLHGLANDVRQGCKSCLKIANEIFYEW